jgi:carbamoyl-phosphate synthase large subunit
MSPPWRVAVTGVSGDIGQGAIHGLRVARTSWILGLDWSDDNVGFVFCDAARQLPPVQDSGYVNALIAALREHGVGLLLPCVDSEIPVVAVERERIERESGALVVVSDAGLVTRSCDKLYSARLLAELDLGPPETLGGEAPLAQILMEVGLPAVVKPRQGHASVAVRTVRAEGELATALAEDPAALCVQRLVEGPEYTCGLLYDRGGALRDHIVTRRWLSQGRTVRARVETSEPVEALIARMTRLEGARGAINLQLRVEGSADAAGGIARIFEINPRLSGSTAMRVALGFNDPARIAAHWLDDERIEPAEVVRGTVYRAWQEVVVPDRS